MTSSTVPPQLKHLKLILPLAFGPFVLLALVFSYGFVFRTDTFTTLCAAAPTSKYYVPKILDFHVVDFHINLISLAASPENPLFIGGFLSSLAACAVVPLVESLRRRGKWWAILAIISQVLGRGIIYPFWWAAFVWTEWHEPIISGLDENSALGVLTACLFGFVLPGILSTWTKSESWTAIWWAYPISFALLSSLPWFLPLPVSPNRRLGDKRAHTLILLTYLATFTYATLTHLHTLLPLLPHPTAMKALLGLSFTPSSALSLEKAAYAAYQWDALSLFGPSIVAMILLAKSRREMKWIALWCLIGVIVCGTGGAVSGFFTWREWELRKAREEEGEERKVPVDEKSEKKQKL